MTQLFSLGAIDPLYVGRFTGFDYPSFVEGVRLISDGSDGPHEVIQGSGIPFRRASVTGHATSDDCDLLRSYDLSKETLNFIDGNGNETQVRVLELTTDDFVHWWSFAMTLVAVSDTVAPGS